MLANAAPVGAGVSFLTAILKPAFCDSHESLRRAVFFAGNNWRDDRAVLRRDALPRDDASCERILDGNWRQPARKASRITGAIRGQIFTATITYSSGRDWGSSCLEDSRRVFQINR